MLNAIEASSLYGLTIRPHTIPAVSYGGGYRNRYIIPGNAELKLWELLHYMASQLGTYHTGSTVGLWVS